MWRLITLQVKQLRRSLANATTLRSLARSELPAPTLPPSATLPGGAPQQFTTLLQANTLSKASIPRGIDPDDKAHIREFEYQLDRLVRFRPVFALQACTTFYAMLCAIAFTSTVTCTVGELGC